MKKITTYYVDYGKSKKEVVISWDIKDKCQKCFKLIIDQVCPGYYYPKQCFICSAETRTRDKAIEFALKKREQSESKEIKSAPIQGGIFGDNSKLFT